MFFNKYVINIFLLFKKFYIEHHNLEITTAEEYEFLEYYVSFLLMYNIGLDININE
jgi:hypothetical protein